MYIPSHFAAAGAVRRLLASPGAANLATATADGPTATLVPFVHDPTIGAHGALLGHLAHNNLQWSEPPLGEAMAIIQGADAYVSPSWYASKSEHGGVVPAWNYSALHVYGELVVHDDPSWLARQVEILTGLRESGSEHPRAVQDAPAPFIAGQFRAIGGIELRIARIEGKIKPSRNRPEADIDGVVTGLGPWRRGKRGGRGARAAGEAGPASRRPLTGGGTRLTR